MTGTDEPPPETEEDRLYRLQRDAEENQASALPSGEEIRFVGLTCVEMYTPSTIGALRRSIVKLGWVRDDEFEPPFTNLDRWLDITRGNAFGGAWANLSRIGDEAEGRPLGGGLTASMPAGFSEAWAGLYSVTPSLSCLVLHFVADDTTEWSLHKPFEVEWETQWRRRDVGGWTMPGPVNLRREAVSSVRRELRKRCHDWLGANLPGVFTGSQAASGHMPSIEVFTCKLAQPFTGADPSVGMDAYPHVLQIDNEFDALAADQLPGWRLSLWDDEVGNHEYSLRLGARVTDIESDLASYGGLNNRGLGNYLSHRISGFATRYGLNCLLAEYERHVAGVRDRVVASSDPTNRREQVAQFEHLFRLVTDESFDARIVASELRVMAGEEWRFAREVLQFKYVHDWRREHDPDLVSNLRESALVRANNLLTAEQLLRDSISNVSSVVTARVDLRLATTVLWLTWVAVATGVLALVVSLLALLGSG
ncbi:MAG TPA: hypothetical protein VF228_00285 [Iamia sp.]